MLSPHTPALQLEPLQAAHADAMFEVLSDPAIYEFENAPPPSREWLQSRYQRLAQGGPADGSERWLNWVIRLPEGALAGYVQATVLPGGLALVAYELNSRYWRRGLGSLALSRMLGMLRAQHGVHTALAQLKAANHRSLGLLRKLGFTPADAQARLACPPADDELLMQRRLDTPNTA